MIVMPVVNIQVKTINEPLRNLCPDRMRRYAVVISTTSGIVTQRLNIIIFTVKKLFVQVRTHMMAVTNHPLGYLSLYT